MSLSLSRRMWEVSYLESEDFRLDERKRSAVDLD